MDVHLHLLPPGLRTDAQAGRLPGVAWCQDAAARVSISFAGRVTGVAPAAIADWPAALSHLTEEGIDGALVMPFVQALPDGLAGRDGVVYARRANDAMAAAVAASAGRLAGLAMLPTRTPADVPSAARDAAALGLKGIALATHGDDDALDAERFEPVWQASEREGLPVFLHPPAMSYPRLERFNLGNLLGNPLATSTAAATLIFGGVLDRHPALRVVLAHGGGTLPDGVGRLDHGYVAARRGARFDALAPPSSYLRRFWYDAVVYRPQSLRWLVSTVGPDRVMLGTDYPFDMEMRGARDLVTAAVDDPEARALVLSGTARALFAWP